MDRKYNLRLDLQFRCNNSVMKFRQSDNKTSDFFMRITSGGELFNIDNAIAILAVIKPNGIVQSQFLEIKEGKVYADLNSNMKDLIGTYKAQALLIMGNERVSTDVIEYEVIEDNIINQLDNKIEDEENKDVLGQILSVISNLDIRVSYLELNGGNGEGSGGVFFIPSIDEEGNLSWMNNAGLKNPPTVNVIGPQGAQGPKGDAGAPFAIKKTYVSIEAMNADYSNEEIKEGDFVIINTGDVSDEDNGKLFIKGATKFDFLVDISGVQGIQGPKGDTGLQGERGEQGLPGQDGAQGPQGPIGPVGAQGEQGPIGPKGEQGIQGLQGPQGVPGEKGERGEVGPQGPQGPKGDAFKYSDFTEEQLQTLKGDKGDAFTYDDFTLEQLETLKGPKGDKGDAGDKGEKGEQGPQGEVGPKGEQGIQGLKGDKGDKGEKGDPFTYEDFTPEQLTSLKGEKGEQGLKGADGLTTSIEVNGQVYNHVDGKITLPNYPTVSGGGAGTSNNNFDKRIYNVKEHGAKGDGITDDSKAIRKCIANLPQNNFELIFPPGIYVQGDGTNPHYSNVGGAYSGDINMGNAIYFDFRNKSNFKITGYGASITAHAENSCIANNRGFYFENCNDFTIEGLTYDGNKNARKPNGGDNSGYNEQNAFCFKDCDNVTLNKVYALNSVMDGFFFGSTGRTPDLYCNKITMRDCRSINSYRQGLSAVNSHYGAIISCEFSDTGKDYGTSPKCGIDLEQGYTSYTDRGQKNWRIRDCIFNDNVGGGLDLHWGTRDSIVEGCTFSNGGLKIREDSEFLTKNNRILNNVFLNSDLGANTGGNIIENNIFYITDGFCKITIDDEKGVAKKNLAKATLFRNNTIYTDLSYTNYLNFVNAKRNQIFILSNADIVDNKFINLYYVENGEAKGVINNNGGEGKFEGNEFVYSVSNMPKKCGVLNLNKATDYGANIIDSLFGISYRRPTFATGTNIGYCIYDKDLKKPLWWNGTNWVNGVGTSI